MPEFVEDPRYPLKPYQRPVVSELVRKGLVRGKRILEIGCDLSLPVARAFAASGASHVTAINFFQPGDPDALPPGVDYVRADASTMPFVDSAFDTIVAIAVLEHIRDLHGVAQEVARVLHPKGWAFLNGNPLWPSWAGHHVWVTLGDADYRFNQPTNPILPWEHLCFDRDGLLRQLVARGIPTRHAELVVGSVYESKFNGQPMPAHASNQQSASEIASIFQQYAPTRVEWNRGGAGRMRPSYYFYRALETYSEQDLTTEGMRIWIRKAGFGESLEQRSRASPSANEMQTSLWRRAAAYFQHYGAAATARKIKDSCAARIRRPFRRVP